MAANASDFSNLYPGQDNYDDPTQLPGQQKVTDPTAKAADPNADLPPWLQPWDPGSSAPKAAPPGQHWDPHMFNFVADAPTKTSPTYAGGGDQSILSLLQGGMDPQAAAALFNQTNGRTTGNEAQYYNDNRGQTIGLPGGYAALTPGGWTWTERTPETGSVNNGMVTGSVDNGQYQQLNGIMSQQLAMQQQEMQQQQAMRDQFRQSILSQLGKLQNDTTSTDPTGPQLSPIISAYHVQSQRGLDRTRNALAEANYANGTLNSGGAQTQQQGALENAGADEANFTGQQVSQAVTARQQQLQHLLDVGAGFLSQGDQQSIQTELAQLQAKLANNQLGYQYASLGQQNDQFGRSLAQNNEQFGNQLGYNYTALQAQMNQQALMQALGY